MSRFDLLRVADGVEEDELRVLRARQVDGISTCPNEPEEVQRSA